MTIRKRFLLLILLLATVVLAGGGLIASKSFDVLAGTRYLEHEEIPVLNRAHELKLTVVQVQQWLTDISATRGRDGLNDGFDEAESNAQRFKQLISELVTLDPDNASRYESMLPVFDVYYRDGKKMAQAYIEQGPAGGNKTMAEFDESAARMSESVDSFLTDISSDANQKLFIQESASKFVIYLTCIIFALVLIIVFILYIVMSGAINKLGEVTHAVKFIASGDLVTICDSSKTGEIGDLLRNVEQMRAELHTMVSQINFASTNLNEEVSTLTEITNKTESDISSEQADMEQVAAAISQMSATSSEVAQNTSQAAVAADEAAKSGVEGVKILEQNSISILDLVASVNEAAEGVRALRNKSSEIDKVLTVIRDITEQTNLLALNAAIEAARAGEAGRGFAVVADEVRALAQRTQHSASEVQTMITEIQSSANAVNEVMKASSEKALKTAEFSETTKDTFDGISGAIGKIDIMMAQISTASEEQALVTEEVQQRIRHVTEISMQATTNAERLLSSSQEIASSSELLDKLAGQFKV